MTKIIEFISTGNEIMTGLTVDTNFSWTAEKLMLYGLEIQFHTSVGDDKISLIEAYKISSKRANAVIVCGGLGPTEDDLTAESAAEFFNTSLEFNDSAFNSIKEKLRKRGSTVLEIHKKQSMFPRGSKLIDNSVGTSPGFSFKSNDKIFYFLPGVQREFKSMIQDYVIPDLLRGCGYADKLKSRTVKIIGLGESEVANKIKALDLGGVSLGYRIFFPEIHLKLRAFSESESDSERDINKALSMLSESLGENIFTFDDRSIEEVLSGLLKGKNLTIATAESCTGGLLANKLTDVPGSSAYFLRGVVVYTNESKVDMLGVNKDLIEKYGAVSSQVVEAMASGVKQLAGADIGVGISGIAGPDGGTEEKPVGTVFIGIDFEGCGVSSSKFNFHGSRKEIKLITVEYVLNIIRKLIINNV